MPEPLHRNSKHVPFRKQNKNIYEANLKNPWFKFRWDRAQKLLHPRSLLPSYSLVKSVYLDEPPSSDGQLAEWIQGNTDIGTTTFGYDKEKCEIKRKWRGGKDKMKKKRRNKTKVERKKEKKNEKNSSKVRQGWMLHTLSYWYQVNTRKQIVRESDKDGWIDRHVPHIDR